MKKKYIYIGLAAAAVLILIPAVASGGFTLLQPAFDIDTVSDYLIEQLENFSASPYWDVSRYSWGYGTAAPGPTGTITQAQALSDMNAVIQSNYNTLLPKITRQLTANQWAALMSFAYNEGIGSAENLLTDINAGDDTVLEPHWKLYIYAGGSIDQTLVNRRNTEWATWTS